MSNDNSSGYKKETLINSDLSNLIINTINFLSNNCPYIEADINNSCVLLKYNKSIAKFKIDIAIGKENRCINFSPYYVDNNNNEALDVHSVSCRPWSVSSDFAFTITLVYNENCINIKLRDYGLTGSNFFHNDLIFTFSETECMYICNNSERDDEFPYALLNTAWYSESNSKSLTAIKRLPYTFSDNSSTIEMINGKTFANGGIRKIQVNNIYDSSNVAPDRIYPIGNNQFYSLDSNTLMKCGDITNNL